MDIFSRLVERLNAIVWGPPLLVFIIAVGLYLTIRTRGIQFRFLFYALKLAFTRHDDRAQGDISHFQALMTALAGTIGIGSITGVATALAIGGFGAIFWMWVAALVGMGTKYGESILAIKYRILDKNHEMCGGPMYYLENGAKAKWLGVLFAFFGAVAALGTGNMVQANSVALAVDDLFHIPPFWSGIILVVTVGVVLLGGIKRIGKIASILVPTMALFYLLSALLVIILKIHEIPSVFALIFRHAFTGQASMGGFAGSSVMVAINLGISRGVFSSEAGLGTSSIAAAAAKTDTPGRQALISMCSVFITTGIVSTMTALVIGVSGVFGQVGADGKFLDGSALALNAFDQIIPYGGLLVTIALIPFAYSTILGWAYYGEKCIEYLFGIFPTKIYRVFFTMIIFPGSILSLEAVWGFSNMMNGLMALPNLIGLMILSGVIAQETSLFKSILRRERLLKTKK